jgi:hypothetical protein
MVALDMATSSFLIIIMPETVATRITERQRRHRLLLA